MVFFRETQIWYVNLWVINSRPESYNKPIFHVYGVEKPLRWRTGIASWKKWEHLSMQRELSCGQLRHGTRFTTCNPLETLTRLFFIKNGVGSERKEDRYNDKKNKYILGNVWANKEWGKVVVARKNRNWSKGVEDEKTHTPTSFANTNICVGDKGLLAGATSLSGQEGWALVQMCRDRPWPQTWNFYYCQLGESWVYGTHTCKVERAQEISENYAPLSCFRFFFSSKMWSNKMNIFRSLSKMLSQVTRISKLGR